MSNKPHADDITTSIYWQMLVEIESRTDPKKDILDKHLVEGAYRHWNALHPDVKPMVPRWLSK